MSDVVFSAQAYSKIILHAAKYPHCAINGVLLSEASAVKKKEVKFVDAVPLFHIALNLTPMAEVALIQIDELASEKGLVISGYYGAHETLKDCSIEKCVNRISEKIAANNGSVYLVTVDSTKLSLQLDNVALKVAQFSDGNYKICDTQRIVLEPQTTLDVCSDLLERSAQDDLIDFDNHLDDLKLDWLNPLLNNEIEDLVCKFQ